MTIKPENDARPIEGTPIDAPAPAAVEDLMAKLQASVDAAKAARKRHRAAQDAGELGQGPAAARSVRDRLNGDNGDGA